MAEANDTRPCSKCGTFFEQRLTRGRPFSLCVECREAGKYKKVSYPPRPCQWCGDEFTPKRADTRFCSRKCKCARKDSKRPKRPSNWRDRVRPALCEVCGAEFGSYRSTGAPDGWTKCCSDECGRKSRSLRAMALSAEVEALARIADAWRWKQSDLVQAESAALRRIARYREREFRKPCECCGIDVLCLSDMRKKLCDGCRVERKAESARRSRQTPKGRASRKRDKAVRRAKVSIASERIDPMAVFERDRWTCQLCGKRTPRRLRGQMVPDAPELDHIIPLALGGDHLWSNVQCACRACNGRKGARPLGQMGLPLAA